MRTILGLCLIFASACAFASWLPTNYSLTGTFFMGPVKGYTQIPGGGQVASTSHNRPTLSELGIHHNNDFDLLVKVNWQKFGIYGGWQIPRMKESAILDKDLLSHKIIIPAGSRVDAKLKFDWYRLGGFYKFFWHKKLMFAPMFELAIMDYLYAIRNFDIHRQFPRLTLRIGAMANYKLTKNLALSVDVASSLPLTYLRITTANCKLNYQLYKQKAFASSLFAGLEYLHIKYKDGQTVPNHIKFTAWPRYIVGLKLSFPG